MSRAIFFDNDGVLVNTEQYYFYATQEIMAEHGYELTLANYVEHYLVGNTGLFDVLCNDAQSSAEQKERQKDELRRRRDRRFLEYLNTADIEVPGVGEMLGQLKGRFSKTQKGACSIGVVTSSHREHFEAIHRRTGFAEYFDFILTREDYGRSKPDPEPYLLALSRSGVQPSEVLVIEDSPRGVTAALAAGLSCWVVPSMFTENLVFPNSVRKIRSWDEVVEWGLGSSGIG